MKKKTVFNNLEQDTKADDNLKLNKLTPEVPTLTVVNSKKNKTFFIIIIVLIIIVLGLVGVFAYQYFTKDKNVVPTEQTGQENLQKLLNSLDKEKKSNNNANNNLDLKKNSQEKNNTSTNTTTTDKNVKNNFILNKDTDGDGLTDNIEAQFGTDKNKVDTDGDGLNDFEELQIYFSDPNNPDTDGDGYLDGEEVKHGYSPLKGDRARL